MDDPAAETEPPSSEESRDSREARLEALRRAIEPGEYRVSPLDIAGSIIDEHLIAGPFDKDNHK